MKTKWWEKELATKSQVAFFLLCVIAFFLTFEYVKKQSREKEFAQCSRFTIAKVDRLKYRKLRYEIIYSFSINEKQIEYDDRTGPNDTGDWLSQKPDSLRHRRFWVQLDCGDPKTHKLLWDYRVPDSVSFIPKEGWKTLPTYALKK
ncbi:hypothetical protein J2I47_21195 [Fibrella sp. HMF5335]|uniref:Uncharacterized protein n=1 Tax=Fibrella rubiginis TaxID=2817060 RepID=A0A939K544_9BACT|nr:hypothetical protein [Fibrella rubiginis]MBO0939084.1 hypothetical protein [Fibrella rubiginis]